MFCLLQTVQTDPKAALHFQCQIESAVSFMSETSAPNVSQSQKSDLATDLKNMMRHL